MQLRQLQMFIAVADNLSFTRASEQLRVAQSAISRQIGLLEHELGEPLQVHCLKIRGHKLTR